MIRVLCCLGAMLMLGCAEPIPRKPLNQKQRDFLDQSVQRNKLQFELEQKQIQKSIQKDTTLTYNASSVGFWFSYLKKTNKQHPLPEKGDEVVFNYKIEDLNQNLIYDEKTLGTVRYFIDEEELLPALREGVKLMRPNEVVVFLFPSYLCYGYLGDGEQIGINQPLRFTVKLQSITKNKSTP